MYLRRWLPRASFGARAGGFQGYRGGRRCPGTELLGERERGGRGRQGGRPRVGWKAAALVEHRAAPAVAGGEPGHRRFAQAIQPGRFCPPPPSSGGYILSKGRENFLSNLLVKSRDWPSVIGPVATMFRPLQVCVVNSPSNRI